MWDSRTVAVYLDFRHFSPILTPKSSFSPRSRQRMGTPNYKSLRHTLKNSFNRPQVHIRGVGSPQDSSEAPRLTTYLTATEAIKSSSPILRGGSNPIVLRLRKSSYALPRGGYRPTQLRLQIPISIDLLPLSNPAPPAPLLTQTIP